MILKLVLKSLRYEKMRLGTAALGVAAATGLFVWSLGLVVTSAGQSRERVRRMTAPYTCWVSVGNVGVRPDRKTMMRQVGRSSVAQPLPPELVSAVQAQALPEVEEATPYKTIRTVLDYRPGGRILQGPPLVSVLTLAATSGCPYAEATVTGRWPDPASEVSEAAVCTAVFTPRRLTPPPLGSMLTLITPSGTVEVKITAYVDFKEALPGFPTSFVTLGAMRQASGGTYDPAPDLLLCKLRDGADTKGVKAVAEPVYKVLERKDVEAGYSSDKLQNSSGRHRCCSRLDLDALCMLVNALTIGVEQKRRVLALLRAAGMTAKQVSQVVMLEGAIVAFAGWAVGLATGWMILAAFVARTPDAFPAGVIVGWVTPVSSLIGVALVAAVSLIWPCRHAMRIKPLDALAEQEDEPKPISWWRSLLGFILLFPMLVLVLPMPITAMTRSVLLLALGLPLHVLGLLLVLPSFVSLMERVAAPAVSARCWRLIRTCCGGVSVGTSRGRQAWCSRWRSGWVLLCRSISGAVR